MIFEVCVDSVEGALAAQAAGAERIELCANLVEGGTTPSQGMLELARRSVSLAINVIIRPRGGDFCYSGLELETMRLDILAAKEAGANGIVLGLLNPDGSIDRERTQRLVKTARPLSVTFHRAFDLCRDPAEALETLCELGIERVLTSGQKPSALEGAACIAALQQQAAGRIIILAGGGVNAENIATLVAQTGVNEVHFAARKTLDSPMRFRNTNCFMGKTYQPDEYIRKETDLTSIEKVIRAATDPHRSE
ncbi:MAG: copper homeostasis protein CutC [Chloroflexota bacterium]